MRLIDTHCHLCHGRLLGQVNEAIVRARAAGVVAIVCAVGDYAESKAALGLVHRQAQAHGADGGTGVKLFCMAGVHPHEAKDVPNRQAIDAAPPPSSGQSDNVAQPPSAVEAASDPDSGDYLRSLEALAADPSNVAIGEIGLDYHYDFSPRPAQREVFAQQLQLARRLGKPIVIHTREAFEDTMSILAESGVDGSRIVFHSFTGSADEARRALDIGASISFSGIVTFKGSQSLREAAMLVPPDRMLIETDAPYLTPEPVRKMKTNEPANVAHVAACLAAMRNIPPCDLAEHTTANAISFFGLAI